MKLELVILKLVIRLRRMWIIVDYGYCCLVLLSGVMGVNYLCKKDMMENKEIGVYYER